MPVSYALLFASEPHYVLSSNIILRFRDWMKENIKNRVEREIISVYMVYLYVDTEKWKKFVIR
jgi:hypothetical protein